MFNIVFVGRGWETCMDGVAHCRKAGTFTRWRCSTDYSLGCVRLEWCLSCQPSLDTFQMQLLEFFRLQK